MSTDNPMIAHVHVPKTAGTAINAVLEKLLGPGRAHIQAVIDDSEAFGALARDSRWIAGHVPAPKLCRALADASLRPQFVTALRTPVEHVASHYNWLIEIGHRGETFLNGHPRLIREIHHHIRISDNNDPKVVIRNLQAYAGLFLNCQARHVVGPEYAEAGASYAAALEIFDSVIFSDDVAGGLALLFPGQSLATEEKNMSQYHFERAVFGDSELRAFLHDRNRADEALWAVANAMFRAGSASNARWAVS